MGKASIYNPYLDTLGGGEKYTLSFAKVLADKGYDVFVEWPDESIRKKLINRFGFKLPESINFVKSINRGDCYDLCFWVSDGSIPTLRARKNFIHFQVPFQNVDGRSLLNKMKLFRVNEIICNSEFTKRIIDKEYGVSSKVLYPPIDIKLFKPRRKENQICYVGRFSNLVQNKGHENLIISFKKLVTNKKFKDWKLILAGGIEVGVGDYVTKLKKMSNKFNIEIIESPDFDKIKEIYGKSKFFWSAAGFAVDEIKNPEKVEHFGITLIESMASGCVPIVHNSGGFKEIIDNSKNGFLWDNLSDLVNLTKETIGKPSRLWEMSINAQQKSKSYSYEKFKSKIEYII